MSKPYSQKKILTEPLGNNAFAWQEREVLYGQSPTLTIPSLIDGTLDDVILGDGIVFEEMEDGTLRSCRGLENFVRIVSSENNDEKQQMGVRGEGTVQKFSQKGKFSSDDEKSILMSKANSEGVCLPPETFDTFGYKSIVNCAGEIAQNKHRFPTIEIQEGQEKEEQILPSSEGQTQAEIVIFDNHNHALYFWCEAVRRGILEVGFDVIHIDEHSDLWDNPNELDLKKAIENEQYAWEFTNLSCNVGNYIQPALRSGLVKQVIRIENEYQIDEYMHYSPKENTILNLDIDIFAPELDHIPDHKKIKIIKNLLKKVKYVTIATSPYFIDQGTAIEKLHQVFHENQEQVQ